MKKTFLYTGSIGNRENRGSGEGVSVFSFSEGSGKMRFTGLLEIEEPSVLDVSPDAEFLFSTNEMTRFPDGEPGSGGGVSSMRINPETGMVSRIMSTPSLGSVPCYLCADPTGRYVCVAIHGAIHAISHFERQPDNSFRCNVTYDTSGLSLFRRDADGTLIPCDFMEFHGPGHYHDYKDNPSLAKHGFPGTPLLPAKILQMKTTVHCIHFRADGLGIVCDRGGDLLHCVRIDERTDRLKLISSLALRLGCAPRHIAFHPQKPFFYITNELESSVTAFSLSETGQITERTTQGSLREGMTVRNAPADIKIHPSGKYLYASNRGTNTIAVFDLKEDGTPSLKQLFSLEAPSPRSMDISPDGAFLVVGLSDANLLCTLSVSSDGTLSDSGSRAEVKSPSCVRFVQI